MTRRERLERKAERRREWAEKREAKAAALYKQNEPYRGDWAFATQPGYIPERARANRRDQKAFEHQGVAKHHRSRAAGLEDALERSIYSDDTDAIERLEERIAEQQAERDARKKANAAWRKAGKPGLNDTEEDRAGWAKVGEAIGPELTAKAMRGLAHQGRGDSGSWAPFSWAKPFNLTNVGASIRKDRERLEALRLQVVEREVRKAGAEAEADPEVYACPDGERCTDPGCVAENARRRD